MACSGAVETRTVVDNNETEIGRKVEAQTILRMSTAICEFAEIRNGPRHVLLTDSETRRGQISLNGSGVRC